MLQHIENLKLVSVIRGVTSSNTVHTNYSHRLILRLTVTIRYNVECETPALSPGDALFISNMVNLKAVYRALNRVPMPFINK